MGGTLLRSLMIGAATAASAAAVDFGVESKVFDGGDLVSSSSTLFAAGKAYDRLAEPDEAIVCDLAAGRVVLLDPRRKLRAEITADAASEFCEGLRRRARANGSDYLKFSADPAFEESLDAETQQLVLTSPWLDYRVRTTAPKDAEALRHYHEFARLQSMVNTVINPGAAPPFARWKLNEALLQRQLLPEEVVMRRKSLVPGFGKSLRAEHHFNWRIGDAERRPLTVIHVQIAHFQSISVAEYLRPLVGKNGR